MQLVSKPKLTLSRTLFTDDYFTRSRYYVIGIFDFDMSIHHAI